MAIKKIHDVKYIRVLFWVCFIAYFSTYIGRINYNAVMIEIIKEGTMLKSQAGLVSTFAFFAYGIGQLFNGLITDKVSPKLMMACGLLVSALINILVGTAQSYYVILTLWGINGFAQSMTWAPIMKLFAERLTGEVRIKASVNFATSSIAGTMAAYFMCSFMVAFFSWRAAFFTASAVMIVAAVIWVIGITAVENHIEHFGIEEETAIPHDKDKLHESARFYPLVALSGLLFIGIGVIVQGILKDGVTTWVPTYISENFGTSSFLSILSANILPIINLAGVYGSSYCNRKIFKNEVYTSAAFFGLATTALAALLLWGHLNILLSIILLAVITSAMCGVNMVAVGLIPLYFAKQGRAASATGLLNSFAYLGSAVSVYGIGAISELKGWSFTIFIWILLSLLGIIVCLSIARRWNSFKKQQDS